MKNFIVALTFGFVLLAAVFGVFVVVDVWYAGNHAPAAAPSAVEQGRVALHAQLDQAAQREEQIEKLYWNSPEQLQVLIQSHQQRIDKLAGNAAGGEIVAHDQQAIARLQQRIAYLATEAQAAEQAAKEAQKAEAAANRASAQ